MCAGGTNIFENAAKDFNLNERVFVIKNYSATTSYKHVEEKCFLETCQKVCCNVVKRRFDFIEVQGRHFE